MWWWTLALALEDPLRRHQDLAAAAMVAEREVRPADAVAACGEAIAALPDGPQAMRCARRVAFLEARRDADGSWTTWEALERARRDPALAVGLEALAVPEGAGAVVAAELAAWRAGRRVRAGDGPGALQALSGAWQRRERLPEDVREHVTQLQAEALALAGRTDEARAVERAVRVPTAAPRPTPVEQVVSARRRETAVAWVRGGLALWAVAALWRGWRLGAPRGSPWGAAAIALMGGGVWGFAELYEAGAGASVPGLTLALVAVWGVAWIGRAGHGGPWMSVGAAAAAAGVGWLWLG